MSTLEHLFMQISERRDWIEGQLRQQAESYGQTVAYNLVADGWRPPPWLLSTRLGVATARPDPKELNREQLISEILFPFPPSTTSLAKHNIHFNLPTLKGDHISQSDSFFSEMCTLNKYFHTEQRNKIVANIYNNDIEQDSDMLVEPEVVEVSGEFDTFARFQRSRSRQKDLEIRLSKKAKTTNHLGEESTVDKNSGRRTRSRDASAKAACVRKSSDSLLHNEDGDQGARSTFTAQKLDCLEKSVKATRLLDLLEGTPHKATETGMDCRPMRPLNVDKHAFINMDVGTVGKDIVSDEARPGSSSLEIHISNKAKATNQFDEESTMDENSGRMTRSTVDPVKVDCVKKSLNSLLLHNENGNGVARSRFTAQKLDCLEKAVKPTKPLDLIEDAQKAIETEMGCRQMMPFNFENLALGNMDDIATQRCATGAAVKKIVSDAVHPVQSGLKMTHIVVPENSKNLPLVEPKKLVVDGIGDCGLNHNSAGAFKRDLGCSSETVLTDLDAVQSVKEGSCGDFRKVISSVGGRQLHEDNMLHTAQGICTTEEVDQSSNRGSDKVRLELDKIKDCEYSSQQTSSNKPFSAPSLSPIETTCWISENALMHSSLMKDNTSNSNGPLETNSLIKPKHIPFDCLKRSDLNQKSVASLGKNPGSYPEISSTNLENVLSLKELSSRDPVTVNVSSENGQLQLEDAFLYAEIMRDTEEKMSGGSTKKDRLELPETIESECCSHGASCISKLSQPPALSSLKVIPGSFENTQNNSSTIAGCMISSAVKFSGDCIVLQDTNNTHLLGSSLQCTIGQKYMEKHIKESSEIPMKTVSNLQNDSSALFSPNPTEVLLVAEEAEAVPTEVRKKNLSRPTTSPDATETQHEVLEFQSLMRNSTVNNKISASSSSNDSVLPSNKSGTCFPAPGSAVNTSTRDAVENFVIWNTPNTAEICCDLPKSHYFLRSSGSLGCRNAAEKSSIRLTRNAPPNSLETRNAPPKTRYFLRSSTSQEKNVAFTKGIRNNETNGSVQSTDTIARASGISWPKRKKRSGRSNNILATSPRLRLKPLLHSLDGIDCRCDRTAEIAGCGCSKTSENGSGAAVEHQPFHVLREMEADMSNVASNRPLEMLQQSKKRCSTEDGSFLKGKYQSVMIPFPIKHTQGEPFSDVACGSSRVYLEDEMEATKGNNHKLKTQHSSIDGADDLYGENAVELVIPNSSCCYGEFSEEIEMCREKSLCSSYVANDDLVDCDGTLAESEGFSIGVPSTMESEFFFDNPDILRLTGERASMLEQLCRSNSVFTPGSRPSTKYKIYEIPGVYQSLPAGLLEHMNLNTSCQFSDADMKQFRVSEDGILTGLRCNLGSEFDGSFMERSYLHSVPSPSARFGCETKKPPLTPPPVDKFGQKMISGRGVASLEKVGSNPELTCFRIDENSSTTDEDGYLDEIDALGEMVGSKGIEDLTNRKALVDVSAAYLNSPNSISLSKESLEKGTLESVNRESYFGTQLGFYPSLRKGCPSNKSKVDEMEHCALSVGGKRVRQGGDSLHRSSSKPELSGKENERNGSRENLVKGCRPNNIVSNISSFVPLVRKKQEAAAPVKGKKEIRVKALEAAEALKRLEEKKRHERDIQKAASKFERKRMEQENFRRLELKQKKKVQEKKKEADIVARKRQREEEKRKEKERKRRCAEETRKRQREQEVRLRPENVERELRQKVADEKEQWKKEMGDAAKRQLKLEKGVAVYRKVTEAETNTTNTVADNARCGGPNLEAHGSSIISSDIKKVIGYQQVVRDSDSLQEAIQDGIYFTKEFQDLKSYDMSPYIDSDNEDVEEERRKRKYVPLWARREFLDQIILSKKELDPSAIFSRKRSFNLNEVLLPRIRRRPL